ncbi:hypothetical protein [Rhodobacter capsulatus]|uniref:hypothetical protein n=1 Tax=Rhodobacter capsulatus TaxID=1061 RepID=UPI0003D318E3|nr:hypothetical protein [Rhodobacter capsulatus]ETD84378.1 hypothetical protein U716_07515 [Rhodobacter capsulatus B6]
MKPNTRKFNRTTFASAHKRPLAVQFAILEWERTREQVHLLLGAIWRFEAYVVAGYAAFFSVITTRIESEPGDINKVLGFIVKPDLMVFVGLAFLFIVAHRLTVEYAILMRLAEYTRHLEEYIYLNGSNHPAPVGWETFLADNRPDDIGPREVSKYFTNTRNGVIMLLLIHVLAIIVIHQTTISTWLTEGSQFIHHHAFTQE